MRWLDCFESVACNASAWCSLNKEFEAYSIQEISLNWIVSFLVVVVLWLFFCISFFSFGSTPCSSFVWVDTVLSGLLI